MNVYGAVVAVCLFAAQGAFAQGGSPTAVVVESARATTLVDRVEALGTLQANELIEVSALITERIAKLHFDDGDQVDKDAILVEFDMDQERALLAESRAVREEARSELQRFEDLIKRGVASETDLSVRQREFAVAQARVRAVQAQIDDRTIRAPFAGRIGIRGVSAGATVSPGQVIARLADTSVVKLDFSIPSTFLAQLEIGTRVEGRTRAYSEEIFRGEVSSIDSVVDPVTRSVLVRAIIPNDDGRLKPGLLMTVELLFNERATLTIDERALIPDGKQNYVFIAQPGDDNLMVAVRRAVTIGVRRVGSVEILSGLQLEDQVVVEGALKLRPGAPIRLVEELPRATPADS